ncbi:MAG TPA: hypothetical protein VKA54_11025 [Gemmatimonadaceae bacterium]|nr:hypothetical protein [Gemmatimonadaceae bacterium]
MMRRSPFGRHARLLCAALTIGIALAATPSAGSAQWSTTFEQHYLDDPSNWAFRNNYPAADRLFNAFDYGHAILYERLYTRPHADPSTLEEREYDFITKKLLVKPPRLPLEEAAIEVEYAKLVPEAKQMFDWAHVLHRQVYDILADERVPLAKKDARIARVLAYYKTRPDLAFSSVPKTMDLMEGEYYGRAFRLRYPKFNGLIWGYHWLQVGLYEPLLKGTSKEARRAGVQTTTRRFFQMLENAPQNMPRLMPMTPAIAPTFTARYPEVAIIFDNLHGMHDVISDVLASRDVPRDQKRAVILGVAERYRDSTSYVMSRKEWLEMADMMGIHNMGGPAVDFPPEFQTPTVERGATMAEVMKNMDHGAHTAPAAGASPNGARPDSAAAGGAHQHDAMPQTSVPPPSSEVGDEGPANPSATRASTPAERPNARGSTKSTAKPTAKAPAKRAAKPKAKPASKPTPKSEQPEGHVHTPGMRMP